MEPIECKKGTFDSAEFAESDRQTVLTWISSKFAQHRITNSIPAIRFSISLLQDIVVNPVADRGSGFVSRLARPNAVYAATGTGHYVLRSLDGDALAKNGAEDFHFRIA